MAREKGTMLICDRCGKQLFRKEIALNKGTWTQYTFEPTKDWGTLKGLDLCADCNKEHEELERNFLKTKNT